MSTLMKRAGLVVALSIWTPPGDLLGQEPRGPIDVLFAFVREKVAVSVLPEQRPYDPPRMFLRVGRGVADRTVLGSLEKRNLNRLGITLADERATAPTLNNVNAAYVREGGGRTDVLVFDSVSGAHVQDDGVYVVITSAERANGGGIAVTFDYYVTWQWNLSEPGRKSSLCLEEWVATLRPARMGGGWEVAEAVQGGHC